MNKGELYKWEMLLKSRHLEFGDVVLFCFPRLEIKLCLKKGSHSFSHYDIDINVWIDKEKEIHVEFFKEGLQLARWQRIFLLEPVELNPEFIGGKIMYYDPK